MASCIFAQKSITLEELRNMYKKDKKEKAGLPDDPKVSPTPEKKTERKEAEVLASGQNSSVEKPFIYIARTKEDLAVIKGLAGDFSNEKEIDFTKQAVIAAFAGMKNTGGYSVSLYQLNGKINVSVKNPPKDAFVTQVITQPFKVSIVSLDEENSLHLAVSEEFKNEMTTYKVTSSEFEVSGGFIGKRSVFAAVGTVGVIKYDDHVTFIYDLKEKANEVSKKLNEAASGQMKGDSSAIIQRLEAGDFMYRPHPPLIVAVNFEGNKLSMKFEPGKRDYVVNDGFEGRGSLEAVKKN